MQFGQKKNHDLQTIFNKMKGQPSRTFGQKMNNGIIPKNEYNENYTHALFPDSDLHKHNIKPKLEK